jgi:hypothetical protein
MVNGSIKLRSKLAMVRVPDRDIGESPVNGAICVYKLCKVAGKGGGKEQKEETHFGNVTPEPQMGKLK